MRWNLVYEISEMKVIRALFLDVTCFCAFSFSLAASAKKSNVLLATIYARLWSHKSDLSIGALNVTYFLLIYFNTLSCLKLYC